MVAMQDGDLSNLNIFGLDMTGYSAYLNNIYTVSYTHLDVYKRQIMNRLNSELRGHAVSYGLCTQWQGDWQNNKSQQELIGMYIRGIDFCIEHDYPTVEYIKGNFDRSLLHQKHIFVEEPVTGANNGAYVLSGKCSGKFSFSKFTAATLHLRRCV